MAKDTIAPLTKNFFVIPRPRRSLCQKIRKILRGNVGWKIKTKKKRKNVNKNRSLKTPKKTPSRKNGSFVVYCRNETEFV